MCSFDGQWWRRNRICRPSSVLECSCKGLDRTKMEDTKEIQSRKRFKNEECIHSRYPPLVNSEITLVLCYCTHPQSPVVRLNSNAWRSNRFSRPAARVIGRSMRSSRVDDALRHSRERRQKKDETQCCGRVVACVLCDLVS